MPIYAYKCESCGFAKDVLQKISDAPLEHCPACAQPQFRKQLTAAGFQLKGSGWYVTDFKGSKPPAPTSNDPTSKLATDAAPVAATTADAVKPASAAPTADSTTPGTA